MELRLSSQCSILAGAGGDHKPRRLPKDHVRMANEYLPDFQYYKTSTKEHRHTCGEF